MSDFVHLHVHTQYSLLDGFSDVKKIVQKAKDLNMPALGITDHGTMFGVIKFFNEAKKAGIKPIIGVESYLSKRKMTDKAGAQDRGTNHLLLLAENQTGYQNLLKIASASQIEGFYYFPRIDHEFLAAHSEGIICTSGCMAAEIPRALVQENPEEAVRKLDWYYEVFGPDRFFIELQSHQIPEMPKLNQDLLDLGKRYNSQFIATNDVHYVNQEDAKMQDIMLCIQTGSLVSDTKRMKMSGDSFYLKNADEMKSLFGDVPSAISNTLAIAERCTVDLSSKGTILPEFEVPEEYTVKSYLYHLCEKGLYERYGESMHDDVIQERLNYELGIIDKMGYNAYFLIVWDLCQYSQKEGIWYNARGSAAGSIVAYALEITLVDPIEHKLIFERFLNPDRVSMPDIDLDFQDDLRYKLMEYCAKRYGEDKVASIITFGKMKARGSVRDVGRVQNIPLDDVDRIAKMIPMAPLDMTIRTAIDTQPDLKQAYNSAIWVKELLDTAIQIEGSLRNAGTHAAGVVITDRPVVDYIPLHRPTGNAKDSPIKTVTQFDMKTVDSLGLLKVDFLGLSTLTIMQRACKFIKERHDIDLDLHNIPLDDESTYEMLGRGETAGVFQLEGAGMTRWVKEMKPSTLDHVIAMVALYRPGPMEFIPSFIKRMKGEEEIEYHHPSLKPILEETYGITVYQEQIMYTAMDVGGYTAAQADFLRKAVAKKEESILKENRANFVAGATKNDVSEEVANKIFDGWEAFARYGFPKGHAADYAVIAVETAYLKCHYPVEFMTALLSVSKSDMDKVTKYAGDCRKMGIQVMPPDIRVGDWDFTIGTADDGKDCIQFGLGAIKNVGEGPVRAIVEGREGEIFNTVTDVAIKLDLRKVGKRALESMIKVGALDTFGPRFAVLDVMESMVSLSTQTFQAAEAGQLTFFSMDTGMTQEIDLPPTDPEKFKREELNWERELIGIYVSDHPLTSVMKDLKDVISHMSSDLAIVEAEEKVRVAGIITKIRPHITKKGKAMAFVGIEDTQGLMDLVIFPRVWIRFREILEIDKIVVVDGKIDNERGEPKVLVDHIRTEFSKLQPIEPSSVQQTSAKKKVQKVSLNNENVHPSAGKSNNGEMQKIKRSASSEGRTPNIVASHEPDNFPAGWEEMVEGETGSQNQNGNANPDVFEPPKQNHSRKPIANGVEEIESKDNLPWEADIVLDKAEPIIQREATNNHIEEEQADYKGGEPKRDFEKEIKESLPIVDSTISGSINQSLKMVTVIIKSMGDSARDALRVRRLYGMLISHPGNDKFAFYLVDNSNGYRMEYPNETTNLDSEVLQRLSEVVGEENIVVENI
jgi:DNA polymerase III subunit alpha